MIDPVMAMIAIFVIGTGYSFLVRYGIYELAGMNKVMDESKKFQKEMSEVNKKYLSAMKAGKPEKAVELEGQVNQMFFKMLKIQAKMLIFTIPLIFMYKAVLGYVVDTFDWFAIYFPINIPLPHIGGPDWITWTDHFGPRGWFLLSFILTSLIATRARNKLKKNEVK